jgi:hypothetical protein
VLIAACLFITLFVLLASQTQPSSEPFDVSEVVDLARPSALHRCKEASSVTSPRMTKAYLYQTRLCTRPFRYWRRCCCSSSPRQASAAARRRADQQGKYFTIVKYGDLMTTSLPPSASASTSPDQTWDDLLHMVSTGRRPRPGA